MNYKTEAGFKQRDELKSLAASFAEIIDQRKRRGIRYRLAPLSVLNVLAKICGADKPSEIADWVSERAKGLKQALGLSRKRMWHLCMLSQTVVADKENEISAAPRLIEQVAVQSKTVTGDAMLARDNLRCHLKETQLSICSSSVILR